jgi:hypothetical protein
VSRTRLNGPGQRWPSADNTGQQDHLPLTSQPRGLAQQVATGQQPLPRARPGELTCKACGLPIDLILAQTGRHILC